MGHASMAMTVDVYAHFLGDEANRAGRMIMNGIVGDAVGTSTPLKSVSRRKTSRNAS